MLGSSKKVWKDYKKETRIKGVSQSKTKTAEPQEKDKDYWKETKIKGVS